MARHEVEDVSAILAEMAGESDRAAITVGGALIEHALELLIKTHFREPQSNTEAGYLFSDTGILGTFWQKIWAAYFMGLIGATARQELDLIRAIRNEVAHNMNPVSFSDQRIASRCRTLQKIGDAVQEPDNPRMRFMVTIQIMLGALSLKAAMLSNPSDVALRDAYEHLKPYIES